MKDDFGEWAGHYFRMVFYIQRGGGEETLDSRDYVWALGEPAYADRPHICASVWLGECEEDRFPYRGLGYTVAAVEYQTEHIDAESFQLYRNYLWRQNHVVPYNGPLGRYRLYGDRLGNSNEGESRTYVESMIECALELEVRGERSRRGNGGIHVYWVRAAQERLGVRLWSEELEARCAQEFDVEQAKRALDEARRAGAWKSVYVIQFGDEPLYKIGISDNPKSRLKTLATGSPKPLKIVAHKRHEFAGHIERLLHSRFSDWRTAGEWFEAPDNAAAEALVGLATKTWSRLELGLPEEEAA